MPLKKLFSLRLHYTCDWAASDYDTLKYYVWGRDLTVSKISIFFLDATSRIVITTHWGRFNLNFQAHPYGVTFLNPWNMPKYPIKHWIQKLILRPWNEHSNLIFWLKFLKIQILNFWLNFERYFASFWKGLL